MSYSRLIEWLHLNVEPRIIYVQAQLDRHSGQLE